MFISSACSGRPYEGQLPDPWPSFGAMGAGGARTVLTAAFTMPAEGANGVAQVEDTEGLAPGQIVHISPIGWLRVVTVNSGTSVTLQNAEYPGSSAPGAVAASGGRVVTTGPQGRPGPIGPSGTVAVGTVASGTPAAVTNTGTATAAVLNFTLPQGDPGPPFTPSPTPPATPAPGEIWTNQNNGDLFVFMGPPLNAWRQV